MSLVIGAKDYKSAIKAVMHDRQQSFGRTYTYQDMARACRVQKTYVSRVIKGDAHLNDDQLYLAADYLGISGLEKEFLALLLKKERSVVQARKGEIDQELQRIKQAHLKTSAHLASESVKPGSEDFVEYYLDPDYQVLHQLLAIPHYQTRIDTLATKMKVNPERLSRMLLRLEDLGLIEKHEDGYRNCKEMMHLSPESPIFRHHRKSIKMEALQRYGGQGAYSMDVLFTADAAVREKLQQRFLAFLEEAEALVRDAPSEEVYYLSFDLFPWLTE